MVPLSAASRHTALVPPAPHPLAGGVPPAAVGQALAAAGRLPRCLAPVDLLVQVENSGEHAFGGIWVAHSLAARTRTLVGTAQAKQEARWR